MQLLHGDSELALDTLQSVEPLIRSTQDRLFLWSVIIECLEIFIGNCAGSVKLQRHTKRQWILQRHLCRILRMVLNGSPGSGLRTIATVVLYVFSWKKKQTEQALERWEWYQGRPMLQGLRSQGRQDSKGYEYIRSARFNIAIKAGSKSFNFCQL